MERISLKAYAKINLGLDVLGKRADGYHDLKMIMQTIDVYDEISVERIPSEGVFLLNSNVTNLPLDDNNLMVKAARLMWERFPISGGLKMHLLKKIPMAAGLAGGSADAAAVLCGINRLYELGLSKEELCRIGVRVGADVPYCILGGTCLAEGIGDVLTSLPALPSKPLVLIKPGMDVSTGLVYRELDAFNGSYKHPDIEGQKAAVEKGNIKNVADLMGNVLEEVTAAKYPEVRLLKARLKEEGACGAMMSGSGPSVFGLFDDDDKAFRAAQKMQEEFPEYEVFHTSLVTP